MIHISKLIKDSVKFVLSGSNVNCDYQIAHALPPIEADPGQLDQVISNIVINASQAMPDGGTIQIRADNSSISEHRTLPLKQGNYLIISIQDHGTGFSEKYLSNIFDTFFTTKQKGKGLGLATAFLIIKNHNGFVTVESELDMGNTFHIYLPVSEKEVADSVIDQATAPEGQGKVLVMDDEDGLRKMVGRTLESLGYQMTGAADGAKAVELYREAWESGEPFDAVILDLTTPGGMGGKACMKELLEINPGVKAIVASGYSNDPVMSNPSEYGFSGSVPKPFERVKLANALHRVLNP